MDPNAILAEASGRPCTLVTLSDRQRVEIRKTETRVILSGVKRRGRSAGARNAVEGSPIFGIPLTEFGAGNLLIVKTSQQSSENVASLPSRRRKAAHKIGDPSTSLRAHADPPPLRFAQDDSRFSFSLRSTRNLL